jgi:hypothetical protein
MSIVIVGHGPSMLEKERGSIIDSFDTVIRQKGIGMQEMRNRPQHFGARTNILCGSATIRQQLQAACEKWIFFDSRHIAWKPEECDPEVFRSDKPLCDLWNGLYRSMRTEWTNEDHRIVSSRTSDSKGHTHMSAGLHTIIYACAFLKPDTITLVGFDNVRTGEFTWSVTRGEDWKGYPDHRWDIENKMLKYITTMYNVKIEHLE